VTANFFETVGEMPAKGQPGHEHEVILSYGLWQRRFGLDPNIIGKTAQINGATYDIVGATGKDFNSPTGVEIWRLLALKLEEQTLRSERYIMPFARLKPGVSVGQAAAEIRTIQAELQRRFPNTETGWTINFVRLQPQDILLPLTTCQR